MTAANAAHDCPSKMGNAMPGQCDSYIPAHRLPQIQAQQTLVWCWAAAAQAIFRYFGYDVPQNDIVIKGYGQLVVTTGAPWAMLRTLNTQYRAVDGRSFSVRTRKHIDVYSWLTRDAATARLQTGLTNIEIFDELRQERPVFYASQSHAMALVGAGHVGPKPVSGAVLDPAPRFPMAFGPITDPRVPAVGLRFLQWHEMSAYFAATVEVSPH